MFPQRVLVCFYGYVYAKRSRFFQRLSQWPSPLNGFVCIMLLLNMHTPPAAFSCI